MRLRLILLAVATALVFLSGCGDDGDTAQDDVDRIEDTVQEGAEDVAEAADDAWATFRTGFERLIDQAETGDSEAQEQLLDECRDTLEELRKADDPDADRVGELCDRIRDADEDADWEQIRQEFQQLDDER